MATINDSTFREGQSTTRPPFFDDNEYAYWKTRMKIYLQALNYEIWEVVCDGPFMPMFKDEVGDAIPKPSSQWSELEKRKMSLNSKAMNALFCALDKKEFHRVSSCESAQEIWNKLEVVYEGTNQVKESKISRYTRQYELFQMEQNESVYSMYTRFTDIVNTLGVLGKTFSNSEKVKKIIRSLPKEWRPKRTAIEEAKNLNTLPLDDLIGSLISYEEDLAAEKGDEEKKKSIALKASKYESDGDSEPDDEELAMLARRFRKFFKKTGERRKFRNFKNQREKKEVITCYEYKKLGHIRSECPLINNLKKKAMLQEVSNLALMAIGEDDNLNEGLKKKKNKWYLDSGCSRHMTGNYAWFSSFTKIENGGDVSFGDNSKGKILGIGNVDGELQEELSTENQENAPQENQDDKQEEQTNMEQHEGTSQTLPKEWRYVSSHPKDVILGDPSRGVTTRSSLRNTCEHNAFISQIEPKSFADAENDESWIMVMQEELNQFERNNVWELVPKSEHQSVIDFSNLVVYGRSIQDMLQPWESAIDFDDRVYPNLVRVFYLNMEISAIRLNRIVTQVGGVPIEFDDADLADFLGISSEGHDIYTSRKALFFDSFCHTDGVRNICRRRDLSDEICLLPFWSQLLPLQVRILHTILQHIVTPRKGHSDEVMRLDVGLLDSLLSDHPINLGYVIVRHMLSTLQVRILHTILQHIVTPKKGHSDEVTSIITKILRRFEVPLLDTGHIETRRIGPEAMTSISFSRKNGVWIKTSNSKNRDTLIAPEDDRMLNDIYPPDQRPDFRLGAHPHPPRRRFPPPAPEPSTVPEQPSASMPPPAPVQPPASDIVQQLIADVHRISERQQLILDRLDTFSLDQQQLRSDFQTFQQQSIDQQLELIARHRTLLSYFGYDPGSTSSPPP
ncbi:hypothetical protein KPL71_008504 [Citrus sinensis]|uniref:Uncharacterized protein n=1 Tax=Citrus sinensis TaxID=2711 RepID=A0ACB8M6L4_CITSI|nr:hypothetical protein KPL71_008504 [Citrus sinensis]